MSADARLERAAERFADTVANAIAVQVERAWQLERERMNAELAELRDEVHHYARPSISDEAIHAELARLNERMAALTGTVAGLMQDGPGSVRA